MTALRWILGLVTALMTAGWLVLIVLGDSFRRSFGASPVEAATAGVPLLVFLLVLGTVLRPSTRWLLHVTAVALAAVAIACLGVLRESVPTAMTCLVFCALWFLYYRRALR